MFLAEKPSEKPEFGFKIIRRMKMKKSILLVMMALVAIVSMVG